MNVVLMLLYKICGILSLIPFLAISPSGLPKLFKEGSFQVFDFWILRNRTIAHKRTKEQQTHKRTRTMNCFSYPKAQLHEVQDMFQAFATQEDEAYTCPDFLSKTHQKELISNASTNPYLIQHTLLYQGDQDVSGPSYYSLTPAMRETIVEWKYRVVDSCDIDRKIVAQSMNNLDRYTSRCPVTAWTYQLATVTSLYIVAKLHNLQEQLSMAYFVKISNGKFTANHLQDMELKMFNALGWRVNPPVPILQSTYLLVFVLPTTVPRRPLIMELTRFLTEAILTDHYFVPFKASTISIAAIFTAIDISGESTNCHRSAQHFGHEPSLGMRCPDSRSWMPFLAMCSSVWAG